MFGITVSGSLETRAVGSAGVYVGTQRARNPPLYHFFASTSRSTEVPTFNAITPTGVSGFMETPGKLSGSGEIETRAVPITFGVPVDFGLGVLAYTEPKTSGTIHSSWQARITRIQVLAGSSTPVSSFQVTADSGTSYGPQGVVSPVSVPALPAAALALLAGLVAVGSVSTRRRTAPWRATRTPRPRPA